MAFPVVDWRWAHRRKCVAVLLLNLKLFPVFNRPYCIFVTCMLSISNRGVESDFQGVRFPENALRLHNISPELVVTIQEMLSIEIHLRYSVDAIKNQRRMALKTDKNSW